MARSITLTLGAGLGANLGPNFNLTADVGSVTPSTATKTELTAGKTVSVDDLATEVTVTSTGTCTNAITQTIPCAGGTTTTTTSTTTAVPPSCISVTAINVNGTTVIGEPSLDVTIYVSSNVSADTSFNIDVVSDYGTNTISVTIFSGNSSGNSTTSIAPSGAAPSISSYCIAYVDNNNIKCDDPLYGTFNCVGYTCPCGASTSTTTTTTSGGSAPTVDTCGGSANLAIVNNTSATSIGYTLPTDGFNDLSVCTIGGSPLSPGTSDSFVGAFASSYYTEITNATGKTLRTWVGGTIFSTISIIGSPHLQYGDTGYGSSLVILEIID